jgi:hypothetical protein
MPDPTLFEQFEEFLNAKMKADNDASLEDDEEIEIWDEKGRGARVRRSRAKPFLQTLGIDLDPPESENGPDNPGGNAGNDDKKGPRRTASPAGKSRSDSVTRKYFMPKK